MTEKLLAIDGGSPTYTGPRPHWPPEDASVREALLTITADGSWGRYHGEYVERLASELAALHDVPFVLPCCSGTLAVELALRGLRVEAGQEVILAGYDFPGNFRAIEAVGAVPVLVDIEPATWCLSVAHVEAALTPLTRAIVVSHLHGGMADMLALRDLADRHQLLIVEDACQAPGACVQGRVAGTWGDTGVLSFGGSKLLTAGRGGAVLTRDESVWQRMKVFCERGNHAFPLSELQAAVLLPQVSRLAERNAIRRANVAILLEQMRSIRVLVPLENPNSDQPSYYKVAWRYQPSAAGGRSRDQFLAAVQAEGIALDAGFRGFLRRTARSRRNGSLEHSSAAAEQTVLLHHPVLLESVEAIGLVAQGLLKVATAAESTPDSTS